MTPQETFVTRLRRQRQKSRLTLEELAAETRVKLELLEAFERNDLSEWPRGLYARAWVRAYADAVSLDPADTVDEFCRLFPHGDRRAGPTIQEIAAIVAEPSQYRDEHRGPGRRSTDRVEAEEVKPAWHAQIASLGRSIVSRMAGVATPEPRARRTPRTLL